MIYKFETDHCPMCKQAERLLHKHNVYYMSVDAEESTHLVEFYGIKSVPTLVIAESLGEPAQAICLAPQNEKNLIEFINKCNG